MLPFSSSEQLHCLDGMDLSLPFLSRPMLSASRVAPNFPHGTELEAKCLQREYVKDLLAGTDVVSKEKLQCCCQRIDSPSIIQLKSSKIRIFKKRWNYVFCTYFSTEKYAPCSQKYAPCTGTFWGTGEIRNLYVLCTYFARILGYGWNNHVLVIKTIQGRVHNGIQSWLWTWNIMAIVAACRTTDQKPPQHANCYLSETSNALTGEPNFFTTLQRSKRFQIWIRKFSELEKVHVNFFEFVNPVKQHWLSSQNHSLVGNNSLHSPSWRCLLPRIHWRISTAPASSQRSPHSRMWKIVWADISKILSQGSGITLFLQKASCRRTSRNPNRGG